MNNILLSVAAVNNIAKPATTSTTANTSSAQGQTPMLQNQQKSIWGMAMPILLFFLVMYFLMVRPQKKKEKEAAELRSKVDIGDEITTIGGIVGTVVSIKDDFIVIETSGDRNKLRINRWAIQTNNTAAEAAAAKQASAKEAKK